MSEGEFFHPMLLELAAAAGAIYAFVLGFKSWRALRALQDTPTSRVRSAAQGYVEFEGHGVGPADTDIRAPLTRKPCIWWSYKIETCRGETRGWRVVETQSSETSFRVDDSTGRCVVDPRGADVYPDSRSVWYGSTRWPEVHIPDATGLFGRITDFMLRGDFRYTERRISAHVPLCVIGLFRTVGGAGQEDTQAEVGTLLSTWKKDQAALLRDFDHNRDGILDGSEWDEARAAARAVIEAKHLHDPAPAMDHVLARPSDGRPFLIASGDFTRMPDRLKWRCRAGTCAFLALVALLAWLMASAN